ncbi:MAG: amidohydrolase [Planctomycetaceae bacterium]|nr:amidohydrolase [Planctomycetaceae bacterium]
MIDAHSHIWTRDIAAYPLAAGMTLDDLAPSSFTVEELLNTVQPLGVARVVLIQHRPFHGVDNSYLTDTMARYPGVFSAVACIDASQPSPDEEMSRLQRLGVRGFRIVPREDGDKRWADSPGVCRMWQHAGETGLAICPLIDAEFLPEVDGMCERYPQTPVVIDHFARIGVDGEIRDADVAALAALAKHPHVNVKVSAFYALGRKQPPYDELVPMIRRLYDAYGPERLMWASDSPYQMGGKNTYADSLAFIRDRVDFLTPADKQWLLRKTAARVYFGESESL